MKRTSSLATRVAALLLAGGIVAAACSSDDNAGDSTTIPPAARIVVTSVQGDDVSQLLAAIYARTLEDAGFRVARRDAVDMTREQYYADVQAGTIDLIPEFTQELLDFLVAQPDAGAAPTTVLPSEPATTQAPITIPTTTTIAPTTTVTADSGVTTTSITGDTTTSTSTTTSTTVATTTADSGATTTTVAPFVSGRGMVQQITAIDGLLPEGLAITSGTQAYKNDVIACTADTMSAHSDVELVTYTNLASIAPSIRLGASQAWQDDPQTGLPAWDLFYGGEFQDVVTVDDPQAAIDAGDVDCIVVNSLDTIIKTANLTMLFDDQSMTPVNAAIALLSADGGSPDVIAALDTLAASLTTQQLNNMLYAVQQGTDPIVVANAFVDSVSA